MMPELTFQVMQALRQTDEWDRLWKEDPAIQKAKAQLESVMERVGLKIPGQLADDLWSAVYGLTFASENASLLYGIRVMMVIYEAATCPDAIADKLMERRSADVSRRV